MFKFKFPLVLAMICIVEAGLSQKVKTDANIVGHVVAEGIHLPYATVALKGTTLGTVTDETGHYQLNNLPPGQHTLVVNMMGYKPTEQMVEVKANETMEMKIELEKDQLNLDEVVVSANRGEMKRTEAPVIVNTLSPGLFGSTQSTVLGEALNFSPGLRLENNCQNCGFTQIRMNGMEGPYSQILINSRPIFSGLAGVYGLELIPSNMIQKVEVVRGGGSALFGGNAIAGTINIILKDPVANTYEIGTGYALVGSGVDGTEGSAPDFMINANTSLVSDDRKTGMTLYGFNRKREAFDANGDSFSELAPLENLTLGTRLFHRFDARDKLSIDFFSIRENREGGNMYEYPLHERDIAEAVAHNMQVGGISYERYFRDYDMLTVYASGQFLNRDSYYGAGQSLSDYGNSTGRTYNTGVQYRMLLDNFSVVAGVENTSDFLVDKKLGYPEYSAEGDSLLVNHVDNTLVADQASLITGAFTQCDIQLNSLKISAGARFDHYSIHDYAREGSEAKVGDVFSPRLSVMYEILESLQARVSYSQGYRAPQIFDEDLHIETSGLRQVTHVNDPDLKQETSHSVSASLDFNGMIGESLFTGLLVEGFYTRLNDAFMSELGEPDAGGRVVYTRMNANEGAVVQGMNLEFKIKPASDFQFSSGLTLQKSEYEEPQEFNEKRFLRSPEHYGYMTFDWDFVENLCFSFSGTYTGKMLIPYFGMAIVDPEAGELRESDPFFDLGLKLEYTVKLNGATIKFSGGVKNILNAYQDDFDQGIDRDPAYMYGPLNPRTVYFGVSLGNFLK